MVVVVVVMTMAVVTMVVVIFKRNLTVEVTRVGEKSMQ